MGEFRIGEGDPRNDPAVLPGRQPKEQRPDHQAGVIAGDMGEAQRAGDVADGVDAAVGGPELVRDFYAVGIESDAGLVERQPFDIGGAAGCDQQMGAIDGHGATIILDVDANASFALALDAFDCRGLADRHPFGAQPSQDDRRQFGILSAQRGCCLDHRYGGAEPPVRLRHLQADRPPTDDDEMLRPLNQVEQRLIGEVGDTIEAGYRRDRGR